MASSSHVKSKGYERIALYGYSLGTLICLKGYTPEIITMVLAGALTGSMKYNWEEFFTKEQIEELKEKGYITQYISEGVRDTIIIDRKILDGFELINQKELLEDIKCPVLIVHGNNDEEENLALERSKVAIDLLSTDSKLKVIDGADHSFFDHFDVVIKLAVDWFKEYLK